MPKKKSPKKKVKKQPKPKRSTDVQPAPGILGEGVPAVPQPASMPSGLPDKVGHWNHPEKE